MTIDSAFIACFKRDTPHAFTPKAPFHPHAVFCDAQIRLMRPNTPGEKVITWDSYIHRQFTQFIQWYFNKGVQCVIMAFDDYDYVPCAKSMTQVKRRRHLPPLVVSDRDPLPPVCPDGEHWQRCISNRVFKAKVIELVQMSLPGTLNFLNDTQSLIIDYRGTPMVFKRSSPPEPIANMGGMGEADIKFVRYAHLFETLQVDSVDGDSIPIALLLYERGFRGNLSILRMLTKLEEDKPPKNKRKLADTKEEEKREEQHEESSAALEFPPGLPSDADAPLIATKAPSKPKRVYEYVCIQSLYQNIISTVIPQCMDRVATTTHVGHEISMLMGLIGLAGTDYTRGLPQLSGTTLYEQLPNVWVKLARCYDPSTRTFNPEAVTNKVVAHIYHRKYHNHTSDGSYDHVLRELRGSKLGLKTKEKLAEPQRIRCTVRNTNWLLHYWSEQQFPDPVDPEWGYARVRGVVNFAE